MVAIRKQKKRLNKKTQNTLKQKNTALVQESVEDKKDPNSQEELADDLQNWLSTMYNDFEASIMDRLSVIDMTREDPDQVIKTIVEGIDEGVREELKIRGVSESEANDLMKELLDGVSEGIQNELKVISKQNQETYEKTLEGIEETFQDGFENIKGTQATITPKTEGEIESQAKKFISGKDKPMEGRKFKTGEFFRNVLLKTVGAEDYAESLTQERMRRDEYVEGRLGVDPTLDRKQVEREYAERKTKKEELEVIQKKLESYRESGDFTDEQIAAMPESKKRRALVSALSGEKQTVVPAKAADGSITLAAEQSSAEETQMEQAQVQERVLDEDQTQTELLTDIRDILKEQAKAVPSNLENNQQNQQDSSSLLDMIPDFRKPKPGKGGGLWKSAKNLLKNAASGKGFLGKVAMPLAAGTAVYSGVSDLAEGKATETLGDVVPEGWDKINPFSWAFKGGAYVGDKVNKGFETLAGDNLGSKIFDWLNPDAAINDPNINAALANKQAKPIPNAVTQTPTDTATAAAAAMAKNITVQAPPPVVVPPAQSGSQIMSPPFSHGIRNSEQTLSGYINRRYLPQ